MKFETIIDECKEHKWMKVTGLYALRKVKKETSFFGKENIVDLNFHTPVIILACERCSEMRLFSEILVNKK